MNELQIFSNPEFGTVRTILIEDQPWAVGKDMALALGYSDAYGAIRKHVDPEDRQNCQNDSFETPRGMTIINESGMYSLILSSKLESAQKFKEWVTRDVLPSIRKNGIYITPELLKRIVGDPAYLIGILQKLLDVQNENTDLREQNKLLQEKDLAE